jgi:hypothetical protein
MESQEANELWSSFSQEMERYLNTSALNNSILDILNDPKASRFEINLDNLPKE